MVRRSRSERSSLHVERTRDRTPLSLWLSVLSRAKKGSCKKSKKKTSKEEEVAFVPTSSESSTRSPPLFHVSPSAPLRRPFSAFLFVSPSCPARARALISLSLPLVHPLLAPLLGICIPLPRLMPFVSRGNAIRNPRGAILRRAAASVIMARRLLVSRTAGDALNELCRYFLSGISGRLSRRNLGNTLVCAELLEKKVDRTMGPRSNCIFWLCLI